MTHQPTENASKKPDRPHYADHRRRLRERFMRDLGAHMDDYELLELLLCQAIPRRDVKPLAKSLLQRFGSFGDVVAASPDALGQQPGLGEAAIVALKLVQQSSLRLLRHDIKDAHILSSWQAVLDYLRAAMGREPIEQFRLLFLDNRNRLIADEIQQTGTVDHTPVYPREVVRRALEHSASAVIMVHNHPSGDPSPSRNDIDMTKAIADALSKIEIRLHDHIIIGKNDFRSLKTDGWI